VPHLEHETTEDAQSDPRKLDDETEAGFAALALQALTEVHKDNQAIDDASLNDSVDEEEEVNSLLWQVEDIIAEPVTGSQVEVFRMDED
jgi:hypothetical protein